MKTIIRLVLATIVILLGGCATIPQQEPITLAEGAVTAKSGRMGVAMTALPKVDTSFPGAGCLLCVGVASAANSALTDHTRTLPYEDLPKLKNSIADLLRKKGVDATVIEEDIQIDTLPDYAAKGENTSHKDFSSLKQKYNVDKLVVINITALGMWRTYSAYIPTSDPKAVMQGKGYLVNLTNNIYEWYLPVNIMKSAEGKWDEPPKFPGLTNAYFQALETGKDSILKPFASQAVGSTGPAAVAKPNKP